MKLRLQEVELHKLILAHNCGFRMSFWLVWLGKWNGIWNEVWLNEMKIWNGIYTLQAVELQKLILAHNSIESLREDLRNLPFLVVLNLSHNCLSQLPAAVGEWVFVTVEFFCLFYCLVFSLKIWFWIFIVVCFWFTGCLSWKCWIFRLIQ